jgi:hypothetical protein
MYASALIVNESEWERSHRGDESLNPEMGVAELYAPPYA